MWNQLARYGNSAIDKIRRIYNQIPITWLPTRSDKEAKRYLKTEKVRSYLSAYGNIARFLPLIDTYTEETAEIRRMYRIMLRDPYVKAAMFTKVFSVASLDLQVNPASKENIDKDAAEWVQYALDHHLGGTEQLIYNILVHGLIDGFSVGEMVWDEVPRGKYKGRVYVQELKPKDSKFLILEGDSYRNVTGVQDLRSANTYHPSNFAIWSHMPLYDSPTGMSDFRAAYRAFWLIDAAWQLRAIAMERYGLPIMIGRYDGDTGRQMDLESKLDELRSQSWITLPPEVQVEALNLAGATKESEFQAAINDLREEMAVAITGASLQMLQGQVADGRGSSQVHKNTSELVQWYLRAQIQAVIYNQIVPALVEYNLPGADYPTISLGSVSDTDLEATLRVDQGLQQLGWVHSKEEIQEKYGRRLPKDKGDELQPQQQQGMGMGGFPGMGGDMGGGMPPEGPDDPNGGGGGDTDLASLLATGKFSEEQTRAILKFAERQRKYWRSPEKINGKYRYSKTKKRGWLPPNSEHAAEGIKPKSAEESQDEPQDDRGARGSRGASSKPDARGEESIQDSLKRIQEQTKREREAEVQRVGEDKKELQKELKNAKSVLADWAKAKFGKGRFDFWHKRLVSDDGQYALQWKPDTTTNRGSVNFIKLDGKKNTTPPSLSDYRTKRDQVAPVDLDANEDLPAEPEQRKQKPAKPEPQHVSNTNDLISRLKDGDARRLDILQHVVNLSAGKDANQYKQLVQDITGKKARTTDEADEILHKHIAKEAGRPELFSEQDVKKKLSVLRFAARVNVPEDGKWHKRSDRPGYESKRDSNGKLSTRPVSSKKAAKKTSSKAKKTVKPAPENPRKAAEQAESKLDYIFARPSSIPNAGEDLKGSARHNINQWRTLAEAEKDGQGDVFATKSFLEKQYPTELVSIADDNPLSAMAMALAMRKFPAKPQPKRYRKIEEKDRQQFVDSFQTLQKQAQEIARKYNDPLVAIQAMRSAISTEIAEIRKQDRYSAIANSLVSMHNALGTSRWSLKKTSVAVTLGIFADALKAKYPDRDNVIDLTKHHAKDIIEGKSINKSFGIEAGSAGKKRFKFLQSDAYVASATRKGGKPNGDTAEEAIDHLTDNMKLRGVQWGNSVTDKERVHHAIKSTEALMDLADALGLPEEIISLSGKLGLAIGARGKGGAAAHYEPDRQVINLTRNNGVGSLAHEWGHFFDHFLGEFKSFATVSRSPMVYVNGKWETRKSTPVDEAMQKWNEASLSFRKRIRDLMRKDDLFKLMSDKERTYWNSDVEVFARTFERHVQEELWRKKRENTYLVGLHKETHPLWPNKEESKQMRDAFIGIMKAFKKDIKKYSEIANKKLIAADPANRDFTNAEQLLERAVRWGNKALSALVRRVIERNPTHPEFLQEDRNVMTEIIARVMAPANLLGQYRVRKLAEIAEKNLEKFSDQEVLKFAEPIQPMAPKNALEYFRSLVPAWNLEPNWTDNLRKRAFTMAVTSEQTILDRVRSIIDKSLALGQVDQDQPVVQIQAVLEEAGISPRNSQYSEMLFRTNMMQAYTQGSQQAMRDPKVADLFPVWRYTGIRDGRQGKDHEVHFGKYYPSSVDFDSVRGERKFNCRCVPTVVSKFKWQRLQQNGARLSL